MNQPRPPHPTGDGSRHDQRIRVAVALIAITSILGVFLAWNIRAQRTAKRERLRRQIEFAGAQGTATAGQVRHLIDFTLTNCNGQIVSRSAVQGKWLIVNFVFSSCSLSCMKVNYRMAEIQKLTADQPDVLLVSLTVDPRTDTPPVLAKFAAQFQADTNRWLFLTGDRSVLYPLIGQSFLGPEDPTLAGLIPGGWNQTDHIAVMDPGGTLRGLYHGMRPRAAQEVVAALAVLRRADVRGTRDRQIRSANPEARAITKRSTPRGA